MLISSPAFRAEARRSGRPSHYFFLNDQCNRFNYETIGGMFGPQRKQDVAIGSAVLIYILKDPVEYYTSILDDHFRMAEKHDIPVLVELDPITFWEDVPEIWNWFDTQHIGYDDANRENVEWTDWGSEHAVKLGWLNWGRQIRLRPMANLFSPAYQAEVTRRMNAILHHVYAWYRSLPRGRKYLLGGIKLVGEVGFGFNNWYYPNGNDLLYKDAKDDPTTGVDIFSMPSRGVAQIGYAALTYSGIKTSGEITAEDIYELESRFCRFVLDIARKYDFPEELLYLHSVGNPEDMMACVQEGSCPSWSYYWEKAIEPANHSSMKCLAKSKAPYWGMAEWNIGDQDQETWEKAIDNAYSIPGCRFISLFNYQSLVARDGKVNENAFNALKSIQDRYNNKKNDRKTDGR